MIIEEIIGANVAMFMCCCFHTFRYCGLFSNWVMEEVGGFLSSFKLGWCYCHLIKLRQVEVMPDSCITLFHMVILC